MPTPSVQLEERPGIPLAVIRRQVSPAQLSKVVPESCGTVWRVLKAQGLQGGRNVALYWDNVIKVEVGVEFGGSFAEQDGVTRSTTPSGLVAVVGHFGPYGTLGSAHGAIHTWLRSNNHRKLGPRWEIYGHWQSAWDANPSRIFTEVCYLVAPDRA
jgi:effector-binding domain-containing protein